MNLYHEMNKYRRGKSEDGNDLFNVPLKADEDGMIGRECPSEYCQPQYFKISTNIPDDFPNIPEDFSQAILTCPYCGTADNMQQFHTQEQVEWIKSMITRDVFRTIDDIFKKSLGSIPSQSGGLFSIRVSYKSGQLPSVRHYVEEKLKKIVICDMCGFRHAVYGISFHCPLCGKGNLLQHMHTSAETIKVLIDEEERISRERGSIVGRQMLGNALEDVVSLHEGFLKAIYTYASRRQYPPDQADKMISKMHTNFQRLDGAEEFFIKDFKYELFAGLGDQDRQFLQGQFLKRHVLTHNLGLIDKRYLDQARAYERQGAELDIAPADVLKALSLVEGIIVSAITHFQD